MSGHIKVKNLFLWAALALDAELERLGVECDLARACLSNAILLVVLSARMSVLKLKYRLVKIGNMKRIVWSMTLIPFLALHMLRTIT